MDPPAAGVVDIEILATEPNGDTVAGFPIAVAFGEDAEERRDDVLAAWGDDDTPNEVIWTGSEGDAAYGGIQQWTLQGLKLTDAQTEHVYGQLRERAEQLVAYCLRTSQEGGTQAGDQAASPKPPTSPIIFDTRGAESKTDADIALTLGKSLQPSGSVLVDASIGNLGPGTAQDLVLSFSIPEGVEIVEASPCSTPEALRLCEFGEWEPGTEGGAYVVLRIPTGAPIRVGGAISAANNDPNLANNARELVLSRSN